MNSDLIFHVLSKRKWQERNQGGFYKTGEEQVECVLANALSDYLNKKFSGRKNLILLVIDRNRLSNTVENNDDDLIYINEGINLDAVLDKIRIDSNKDGKFDIEVENQ